ncbi:MAG: sensor domain-containing diguanylate cyclase [Acidimicrobiales bacterium]
MPLLPKPPNEEERLAELESLHILDSEAEERFDHVTRLAQRLFGVPFAAITFIDRDRQWFKSSQGLETSETPREDAFCAYTILDDDILYVADATKDERFSSNPYVVGDPAIRFYAGYPITSPNGANLGALCVMDSRVREITEFDRDSLRDLAEIVEKEISALQLATVDNLTGLSNRRGFELLATKSLNMARRYATPATLLYFDIDNLKIANDQFGHAAGDELLREFARLLEEIFRESDIVARLGGDEFAVLLSGTDDAPSAVSRFREAVAQRNESTRIPYTIDASVGTAVFDPTSTSSLTDLVNRADEAMYVAKRLSHRA